jgi:hypothetical protein
MDGLGQWTFVDVDVLADISRVLEIFAQFELVPKIGCPATNPNPGSPFSRDSRAHVQE